MHLVKKLIYRLQLRRYKFGTWNYLSTMLKLIHPDDIISGNNQINLKKIGLVLKENHFTFLLSAYDHAKLLSEQGDVKFEIKDNKLYIYIGEFTYEIQTSEEVFILREIFVDGVYNFNTINPKNNYVVIDIGMNVAIASCYFAAEKKASKVISFEPFTPTFNQAIKNINLNKLKDKVEVHNFGLGGHDEILDVEYTPEFRGQVGMQGIDSIKSEINQSQLEKIEIKDALPVFEKIYLENNKSKFVMKIDCEGAEYELIDRIPQNILDRTEIIMMEWHDKGPQKIEDWLFKFGFSSMSFYPLSKRVGMIYAIKN